MSHSRAAAPMSPRPVPSAAVRSSAAYPPFLASFGAAAAGGFGVFLLGLGVLLLIIGLAQGGSCYGGGDCGAGMLIASQIVGSIGLFFALLGLIVWARRTAEGLLQLEAKVDRLLEGNGVRRPDSSSSHAFSSRTGAMPPG